MRRRKPRQQELAFPKRGGARPGSGRKPKGRRAMVSHASRPTLSGREAVLVTMKVRKEIWNLRWRHLFTAVREQIERVCDRPIMRIVHWSVQTDHVHLVVEAPDRTALCRGVQARGVQGLAVRLARAINRVMQRRGTVFADRFHHRVLASPRQTRNGIAYTLCNGRKHGHSRGRVWLDPCSSAAAFDGWSATPASRAPPAARPRVAPPRTWLLRTGWRRGGGLVHVDHLPGEHDLRGWAR